MPIVQIGGRKITGAWAAVITILLLALVIWFIVAIKPSARMWLTAVPWILFIIYWSIATPKIPAAKTSESRESRVKHEGLLNVALLLLFVPVPFLRWRFLPLTNQVVAVGLAVQVCFALLYMWARRALGRNWSGAVAITENHELVKSGPYRAMRHPMYVAMVGMAVGTAVVCGEVHAPLGVVLMALTYWRKIRIEEAALREAFGASY